MDELVRCAIKCGGDLTEIQGFLEFAAEEWGLGYEVPDLWALYEEEHDTDRNR
jgi:hypothetical protein